MTATKTHRLVTKPQISARHLADFMCASEVAKRSIVRDSKYRSMARVIQHDEAKNIVGKFLRSGKGKLDFLEDAAQDLRNRIADDSFERDLYDHNADYITRFAAVAGLLGLPDADLSVVGPAPSRVLAGTKVTVDFSFRLRRVMKRSNRIRIGAASLRYAKGKACNVDAAEWHAAFTLGYLQRSLIEANAEPEDKLCLTIDAHAGAVYHAPSDSIRRFKNIEAACASIAERWPNVPPPAGAIF